MTTLTRIRAEIADMHAILDADPDQDLKPTSGSATAEERAEAAKLYRRHADLWLDLRRRLDAMQAELDEFPPGPAS
jgi:hypothetical protein